MTQKVTRPPIATPRISKRPRGLPSFIWLLPIVAALASLILVFRSHFNEGSTLSITFPSAAGLEPGKTKVKYKDVVIGVVKAIELDDDAAKVTATVVLDRSAAALTDSESRFWIVRPRIELGKVSGVDTILSGTFIAADKGRSGTHSQRFAGLDAPPSVLSDAQGSSFVLSTQDLGSLDIGSPVYYKRYAVGKVSSYTLKPDGSAITVQVFIDAPYDRLISGDTRFWNAAGLDLSLDANGLKLHAQTLASVISGGIAFSTPADVAATPARQRYVLAQTEEAAMASPAGPSRRYRLRFDHALRGLAVGAPVEFLGRNVGSVQSIDLDYSNAAQRFPIIVDIEVFPARMGNVLEKLPRYEGSEDEIAARFLKSMVDNGLRAQAKSGNLLTGQLYIGLDFVANAPKVKFSATASPLEIPTTNGSFDRLQEQLASIIGKIDDLPLKNMAAHLDSTLVTLNHLATQFDREVLPAATETMRQASMTLAESREVLGKDSRLTSNLNQTLEEIRRASRSVRDLADFLGRHPESVLWGK